ncbi:OLC1v1000795C1 [Oldenlandia corymbosa var. corymbosa]|uniref:OLC1v1000795C1 n=1 Tax=Oldenlandia corymbosa var. corymbosa TaxID=529605 RepID=A0AAV1D4M2_OLDCO|nr:OLC1v1000795C1 [Oldenlandia corymbosa var. corymbosa]
MDAFSSSFLSSLSPQPQITIPLLVSPSSKNFPLRHISCVSIGQNLPTTTATSKSPLHRKTNSLKPALILSNVLNALDGFINTTLDPVHSHHSSSDPTRVLTNNFAPVDELPPTECPVVEGTLPECLDGAYIRNGPNPQFFPRGPYHLFEGDGMLHCIRISKGKATFCSRFVKTYKYKAEKEVGSPIIPNFFSVFNGGLKVFIVRWGLAAARIISGQFTTGNGIGSANIGVALIGGKLYAMGESDLPYEIKLEPNGDITTLDRYDFDGKLKASMTPHPKIDPETKEAFAFTLGIIRAPFLTFFRVNPDGTKQQDVPVFSVKSSPFMHDLAITKNYAIFPDIQIGVDVLKIVTGGRSPVGSDPGKVPRLGVLPKYAVDGGEMRWFDVPGLNFVHVINAWEEDEGDTIVVVGPNLLSVEHFLDRMDLVHASIEKIKIDLKTGMVCRHPVSARSLEFGVINPAYVGKKTKYVYAAIGVPNQVPIISGVVKLDISQSEEIDRHDCVVASRLYGPGCYGGEPFFVAKEPGNPNSDEDDGYVICFVHDKNNGESRFLVMDSKSPNLDIIATVMLPHRVPSGFHGLFIRESDLN